MKRLLVTLLAALSFNALAVDAVALLRPSPLGAVIAFNSYFKDAKRVYYIRVTSQAADFEKAKKQAFRLASEQVAGTVVLSESELRNSNLTRDEIITYSSGLIDEYKIVDRLDGAGSVKLTMDIWITESVMAQRLLAKSARDQNIDGNALSTRVDSILEERSRGDAVIWAVLRDMPRRGFKVDLTNSTVTMDANRNTIVKVDSFVRWDDRYVNAFTEAAKQTGNKTDPFCWSTCPKRAYYLNGYWSEDIQKVNMVLNYVRQEYLVLKLELQDANGRALARICNPLNLLQEQSAAENPMIYVFNNGVSVGGKNTVGHSNSFHLGQNVSALAHLTEIRSEVVPGTQCRSF